METITRRALHHNAVEGWTLKLPSLYFYCDLDLFNQLSQEAEARYPDDYKILEPSGDRGLGFYYIVRHPNGSSTVVFWEEDKVPPQGEILLDPNLDPIVRENLETITKLSQHCDAKEHWTFSSTHYYIDLPTFYQLAKEAEDKYGENFRMFDPFEDEGLGFRYTIKHPEGGFTMVYWVENWKRPEGMIHTNPQID